MDILDWAAFVASLGIVAASMWLYLRVAVRLLSGSSPFRSGRNRAVNRLGGALLIALTPGVALVLVFAATLPSVAEFRTEAYVAGVVVVIVVFFRVGVEGTKARQRFLDREN